MKHNSPLAFSGVILAGGASRRMGTDKAFIEVDGRALVDRLAKALTEAGANEVFVVGGDAIRIGRLGLEGVADRWPGEGPLGAVVTALERARHPTVFIVATDVAMIGPHQIAPLVRQCESTRPIVLPAGGDRPAVLQGAYHRSLFDDFRRAFEAGERSVWRAIGGLPVTLVDVEIAADLDTPEDLARFTRARHKR